jgi:branched-chain amino acid aminotransferase
MAKFEGIHWAPRQMRYMLSEKQFDILEYDSKVFAISRSVHYAMFLVFEGIRFFCRKDGGRELKLTFLNWDQNLERFRKGIAFNLAREQQALTPSVEEMEHIFIHQYFQDPALRPFLEEMAASNAQGYLRPFTVDEEHSIGVTFPGKPAVRAGFNCYDRYLGEPFCGVVVPNMVRAVGINKTGCLKLGINYLMSAKAVDHAKEIEPEAAAALFLDDQTSEPLENRQITEWDSSCCLFAFTDGTIVKIPESPLILPSVTIRGIVSILKEMGTPVEERFITYGELLKAVREDKLVAICSVGTAGILNRCRKLVLINARDEVIAVHHEKKGHPLDKRLAVVRETYWKIYKGQAKLPAGMNLFMYNL